MANTFEMCGKISLGKEKDKFKPYDEREFSSGWVIKNLKFNCRCGGSSHMLTLNFGKMKDNSGKVYFYDSEQKKMVNADFKDRNSELILGKAAAFSKFVIDLNPVPITKMKYLVDATDKGDDITDGLEENGFDSIDSLKAAYKKSSSLRREFLAGWDMVAAVKGVLDNPKYKNKKFRIRGDVEFNYYNGKYYKSYVPKKIYLGNDDDEEYSRANIDFYFGKESLVDNIDVDHKIYLNGWTPYYDRDSKGNVFADYSIVVHAEDPNDEMGSKKNKIRIKRFTVEGEEEIKRMGVVVKLVNGTEEREIREEDLTEEQQDALFCGDITMEDIRREYGSVFGDRVTENVFEKFARGFSKGAEETSYTVFDVNQPPVKDEAPAETFSDDTEEDIDDLEDDDIWGDLD